MSQIIKAFTGIYAVLFMMVAATGVLGIFFKTLQAQNLHAVIIDELENSDYAQSVAMDAFTAAEACGCELQIIFYPKNGAAVCCKSPEEVPKTSEVDMAEVTLSYPVKLSFFQVSRRQQLIGYAR